MEMQPLPKSAAQAFGLMVAFAGCVPLGWGLSVFSGLLHYNFGERAPPLFVLAVLGSVPVGAAIIWGGWRLNSWGRR